MKGLLTHCNYTNISQQQLFYTHQWHLFLSASSVIALHGKQQVLRLNVSVVALGLCREWRPALWRKDSQIVCLFGKAGQILTERH